MAQIKGKDNKNPVRKKTVGTSKSTVSKSQKSKNGAPVKKSAPKSSERSAAGRKKTAAEFDMDKVSKSTEESKPAAKKKAAASLNGNSQTKPKVKKSAEVNPTEAEAAQPKRRKKRTEEGGESVAQNENVLETLDDAEEDLIWSQQASSIIVFTVALLMLFLIMIPSENLWNFAHNLIFGLFGNMALLWDALLFYAGYMLAKQRGTLKIFETARSAGCIFVLIDAFSYVFLQSDGYRNADNQITGGLFSLFKQIYQDGGKLGGTGLLGGMIGELVRLLIGKTGAVIFIFLLIITFILLLTHTTPVKLVQEFKTKLSEFAGKLTQIIQEELNTENDNDAEEYETIPDEIEYIDVGGGFDEAVVQSAATEPRKLNFSKRKAVEKAEKEPAKETVNPAETNTDENQQGALDALVNKASAKAKKKTKAEEIQEQKDEFAKEVSNAEDGEDEYKYPDIRLLIEPKNVDENDDKNELKEMAAKLIETLDEYGVKASISDISRGPTVTRYEVKPAPGVKINKITNLSNDIALRLAAQSIRIEAPIPGKPAVGIEIPNQNKQMVRIREILGSRQFIEAKGALTVALGKDIEGNIVLCDLSKMPHLLIAGSTGSGKSVCVNSMLMSILYKYSPKEVRMVLIDPKSVEFDMYNGIPHLLVPVVCEPKKAAGALQWAVSEMLKRYGMLREHGARNLDNYNKIAEETGEFEKMCRIVIVIDEMADLMIASPKEVEDAIARLAAMARAAGMHMVLATQRPSVDVITGTIKNNIPSRIALAVSSQIDSRTILDEGGAENLIGYGDMLYHPMGNNKHTRVQGCFVDDREVERVINFIKQNGSAEYDVSIADEIERNSVENSGDNPADLSDKDSLFMAAVEVVTEAGQASTSMLQRRLSVGYARAGRLIDQLEENGIIGPYEGSKPRAVLITHAQWLEMTMNKIPSGKDDPLIRSHSEFAAQTLDSGHEEITARQSEFFNAKETEDDEPEVNDNGNNTSADNSESPRDFTQYFDEESDVSEEKSKPKIRDLTAFFDDDAPVEETILYSTDAVEPVKSDAEDIPPWEDIPAESEDTVTEETSDEEQSANQSESDEDDDDDYYDTIASAPWVRKLGNK